MERPFSQACENNKAAILQILKKQLSKVNYVLEVGSGTGQHAVHFAKELKHLCWQTADQQQYHQGINAWLQWAQLDNILPPLLLDVNKPWPIDTTPAIFSANTVHIMSWEEVKKLFNAITHILLPGGIFCLYGPFNYNGQYSSGSNARFDQWLFQKNPLSAIRNFEAVNKLAETAGLTLLEDNAMPANNRCLVWKKYRTYCPTPFLLSYY